MSWPGIEPGADAWEASTLEKSHLDSCAAEAAFLATQQRKPSPEGSNNIKRSAVLIGENTSKKTGQMSSNLGEIIKKLIPVFGEKPARGLPKPTPTTLHLNSATFTRGENAILTPGAPNPPAELRRGEKGRGEKYCVSLIT